MWDLGFGGAGWSVGGVVQDVIWNTGCKVSAKCLFVSCAVSCHALDLC